MTVAMSLSLLSLALVACAADPRAAVIDGSVPFRTYVAADGSTRFVYREPDGSVTETVVRSKQ